MHSALRVETLHRKCTLPGAKACRNYTLPGAEVYINYTVSGAKACRNPT